MKKISLITLFTLFIFFVCNESKSLQEINDVPQTSNHSNSNVSTTLSGGQPLSWARYWLPIIYIENNGRTIHSTSKESSHRGENFDLRPSKKNDQPLSLSFNYSLRSGGFSLHLNAHNEGVIIGKLSHNDLTISAKNSSGILITKKVSAKKTGRIQISSHSIKVNGVDVFDEPLNIAPDHMNFYLGRWGSYIRNIDLKGYDEESAFYGCENSNTVCAVYNDNFENNFSNLFQGDVISVEYDKTAISSSNVTIQLLKSSTPVVSYTEANDGIAAGLSLPENLFTRNDYSIKVSGGGVSLTSQNFTITGTPCLTRSLLPTRPALGIVS